MNLPNIPDLASFSELLGIPKWALMKYVFHADGYYKVFKISKRNRYSTRVICAPSKEIKGIQRWIMSFILNKILLHDACKGFRKKRSILDNALPHVKKDFILNIDLEDFFPSISIERVVGLYKWLGFTPSVAFALGKLTTYKNKLPQGAPSSPVTANIICKNLDHRLSSYCRKRKWTYTRYADDVTVSGNGDIYTRKSTIMNIIQDEGFTINKRKLRILRNNSMQIVTGLVVNNAVNIPRRKRKRIRALFHQADINPNEFKPKIEMMRGYVAYLGMINKTDPAIPRYVEVLNKLMKN